MSYEGADCHQMEMTHTYGTLRFIVPVEGKKVYSLLPILQIYPFTF